MRCYRNSYPDLLVHTESARNDEGTSSLSTYEKRSWLWSLACARRIAVSETASSPATRRTAITRRRPAIELVDVIVASTWIHWCRRWSPSMTLATVSGVVRSYAPVVSKLAIGIFWILFVHRHRRWHSVFCLFHSLPASLAHHLVFFAICLLSYLHWLGLHHSFFYQQFN